ncbi:pantothenate synthetase [uncultured Defluviicoccus sp.]|uniref:pantoate--beta-alanine ligase (AMP-forming) n=1 Tax=metagenome TaxID=256318 RepID=A0A380TAB2_9ZZZZ|nr:pantothenate synthetase [uncultured Defluviicoccus sp.]
MIVIRSIAHLRAQREAWRKAGEMVGLVPTMGALHTGHLSLVERAQAYSTLTLVTLFVNPTQFAPGEDFDRYPRDEAGDLAKLEAAGVAAVFAPEVAEMYPGGSLTRVSVPQLGDVLEGEFRPGFFTGVATVVAKLLILVQPDVALFGEKDYQQLLVIRRLAADLHLPLTIEAGRTIREPDGLALSSRNAYLSADERRIAPSLYRVISRLAADVAAGADSAQRAEVAMADLTAAGFGRGDYVTVRDGETLQPWTDRRRRGRVLAAAWLGRTRLIDNVPVPDLPA